MKFTVTFMAVKNNDFQMKTNVVLCNMSLFVRKPVFVVSHQVRHKPGCTATEDS